MAFICPKNYQCKFYQIDYVLTSFLDAFDNINELLKPFTHIWKNDEHKSIWPESLKFPQQTFVVFALENYRKNLLNDFIDESYFLYNKNNLIKE